eukprot:1649253-Rhodomonas_salina.1
MHAAKLNSTLASDLPNLSSVPAPVWTSVDICVNEDALNSKLSSNMFGALAIKSSQVTISTFDYDLILQNDSCDPGWGSEVSDAASNPGGGSPVLDAASSPGWGKETAVPVSAGEGLGHSSFPKPSRNKRGKRLQFGDKAPP